MHNVWAIASVWMGIAFMASIISVRVGISVALIEILLGVVAANTVSIHTNEWINFLASFGAVLLTFLAGAEIDPDSLHTHLKASLSIGTVAFLAPFLGVLAFSFWMAGWSYPQSLIAGIALSTTSVAVVYAVLVENGLNRTELGKLILAACFVNDFGTVLALGLFFADFNRWMVLFIAAMAVLLYLLPSLTQGLIRMMGARRVSEPEVKFLFLVLFFLGWLATIAKSEAVLPAYLAGLVVAGVFVRDRVLMDRMRSTAFAILTPFYFIKAGLFVSIPNLMPALGLVVVLLGMKMLTKFVSVWPLSFALGLPAKERNYTTMLMSTGLTFGTISALFGLENKIISQAQYTVLVTVVILSAVVPTLIADRFFIPGSAPAQAGAGVLRQAVANE
jgi:Kef-type K+ transport system membrane component KefB